MKPKDPIFELARKRYSFADMPEELKLQVNDKLFVWRCKSIHPELLTQCTLAEGHKGEHDDSDTSITWIEANRG